MVFPLLWHVLMSSLIHQLWSVTGFVVAQAEPVITYSICGQLSSCVPAYTVQLSPALAKLVKGVLIPFMKAKGMMLNMESGVLSVSDRPGIDCRGFYVLAQYALRRCWDVACP